MSNLKNQERLLTVLLKPVISEKATFVADKNKQVVFEVLQDATKAEVKAAVELLFKEQKVEVASVNIVNLKGKPKRHGRFEGRRNNSKKAYVCLKGDGDLNFVEGVA
jgi:large subunit ribosomal protein L23